MAENNESMQGDLVNLDEATNVHPEPGLHASSGDSLLNAAEVFQQQLEQMTAWKQKLGQQMDLLRRDGVKLMERQKAIAMEKQALAKDRGELEKQRGEIQKIQRELADEGSRLSHKAGELEKAQSQLADMQARREQAERELAARQTALEEREARHLAEDVRLKEGIEQLEEERKHLLESQRQAAQERETIAAKIRELDAKAAALAEQQRSLGGREATLNAARGELEKAHAELRSNLDGLNSREKALTQRLQAAEADILARTTASHEETQRLAQERQALAKQRQEFQKKFETFEQEQAEQLEALSKQTKRLSERRSQVEAAEADLEKALAQRIAQATGSLKEELARTQNGQGDRVTALERQVQDAENAARRLREQEMALQQDLTSANTQLVKLRAELSGATTSLERVSTERSTLANQLAEQIDQGGKEAAKWQKELERAQAAGESTLSQKAQAQAAAAREKIDALKTQIKQLQTSRDELEFQLEIRAEESGKKLEALREQLTRQITLRDEEIEEWKQKVEKAQQAGQSVAAGSGKDAEKLREYAAQMQSLEQQRHELAAQLAAVQETLRRQGEESLQTQIALEGKVQQLEQHNTALEAEKGQWKKSGNLRGGEAGPVDPAVQKQTNWQRQRLLRQAKALRTFRQQIRETQGSLEKGRAEIAQQREQVRSRKENLEQVKRLLEKQEMVMARKLADHNAIKTVAAVGIFVIMVLGSVFFGVYRFVHPVFRSEAVVQLAPPEALQGADLEVWLNKQMAFMRTNEVTYSAWKVLRSSEEHYSMHDVRDEWLASLSGHLSMTLDTTGKTLAIRYTGSDAEGVSQVCNALATAYTTPGKRDGTEESKAMGLGSQVLAKATVPMYPVEDTRVMTCAIGVAGVLLVSLILVMIFRHFMARQLREIDEMADADDAAEAEESRPAIE